MADGGAIEHELGDAMASVLARHERSMATKWVALIETMDGDGQRGIWTLTSSEATAWDTLGMLTYAIQLEQAGLVDGSGPE